MSGPSGRHNALVPILLTNLVKGTAGEVECMIALENLILGVMTFYRPDPRQAAEYLDLMTVAVLDRMRADT